MGKTNNNENSNSSSKEKKMEEEHVSKTEKTAKVPNNVENKDEKKQSNNEETTNSTNIDNKKQDEKKDAKTSDNTKKAKKKMGKFKKFLIVLLLVIVLSAIGSSVYFLKFAAKKIDLATYISLEYEGYNGKATATATINTETLSEFLGDESLAKKFAKKATLELSESENLSNGDEIEVTIDISDNWLDENKLKIKEETVKITVSGIDEANNIDLSKYLEIEYDGLNKAATAKVSIDTEALGKFLDNETLAETFAKKATLEIEDNEELANGDKITINVTIDESWLDENGLELKSNKIKITVKGLTEGTEIDVFKDISISVSGMSPNIKLSVTTSSTDEFIKTVKYTLSKSTGLSNGETVTITAASWDKDMANEKGYVITPITYEYTVNAEVSYPMSTSELSTTAIQNIITTLSSQAKSKANEDSAKQVIRENYTDYRVAGENAGYSTWNWNDDHWSLDLSVSEPQLVALYLLAAKDTSDSYNYIYAIYKVTYTSSLTGLGYDWFITVEAKNLSIKSDGSITENAVYSTYTDNGSTQESAYNAYINDKKDKYTVESINY